MKASEALDGIADAVAADFRIPHKRAGFLVTFAASVVLARMGVRFIPALALSVAAGYGAERLYLVIDDMHQAALLDIERHREMIEMLRPAGACACED